MRKEQELEGIVLRQRQVQSTISYYSYSIFQYFLLFLELSKDTRAKENTGGAGNAVYRSENSHSLAIYDLNTSLFLTPKITKLCHCVYTMKFIKVHFTLYNSNITKNK